MRPAGRSRRGLAGAALACTAILAGCGYIVVPGDDSSPTPAATGAWTAVATKVEAASGGLHVDLTIHNGTGAWSALQPATSGSPTLTTGDGKTATCSTAFVGTGGTSLAPGFQIRAYTGGTKAKPVVQPLFVECAGATPGAGAKLSIPVSFTIGEFNYYSPSAPLGGTVVVDLDKVATDLKYPNADAPEGTVEKSGAPIGAINQATLTLTGATRTATGLELAWETTNPTAYPTYVHIGVPPVVGSDGVLYGFYQSPHLADTPITPAGEKADWKTTVAVPKDVTGLFVLVSVESKQQKNFVSHAIDITDK